MQFQQLEHVVAHIQLISTSEWRAEHQFAGRNTQHLLLFLAFLQKKNAENDYFDQRLECAAPKRWWKYTTNIKTIFLILKHP